MSEGFDNLTSIRTRLVSRTSCKPDPFLQKEKGPVNHTSHVLLYPMYGVIYFNTLYFTQISRENCLCHLVWIIWIQHDAIWSLQRTRHLSAPDGDCTEMCVVYIDDILIFSKTFEEHLTHLEEVFNRLRQAGLAWNSRSAHSPDQKWSIMVM